MPHKLNFRFLCLLSLMISSVLLWGQRDTIVDYTLPAKPCFLMGKQISIALRGKHLWGFSVQNSYLSTVTLGTEVTVRDRHSLGLDASFFGWRHATNDANEKTLYENYERRVYLYLDYKYRLWRMKNVDLYFNLYAKSGSYQNWNEGKAMGYTTWEVPSLGNQSIGSFRETGAGLGAKVFLNNRFYWDLSANYGHRFSNDNIRTYNPGSQTNEQHTHVKSQQNIFYMRLNLAYVLFAG